MSGQSWQVLALLVTGAVPLVAQDEEMLVSGLVVDFEGRAVAEATVATYWNFNGGLPQPSLGSGRPRGEARSRLIIIGPDGANIPMPDWQGGKGVQTDGEGRFEGLFRITSKPIVFMVYSGDRRLSGYLKLDPESPHDGVTIALHPSVPVRAAFSCADLGRDSVTPICYLYLRTESGRIRVGRCYVRRGSLDVQLPPGYFDLRLYGSDMDHIDRPVDVPAGRTELDLGTIDIAASFFALYRGKELPEWRVTAARGVPEESASLANFRGRWLVVEFWGFW